MNPTAYRDGNLYFEALDIASLAKEYGTPLYLYSKPALEAAFRAYQASTQGIDTLICYAVKANSNLAVLQTLAKLGAGFDIVSVGELERVLAAGGDATKVVFSGVGKSAAEMRRALSVGVHCFNVESEAELELLSQVATEAGQVANISLRVNPDVDAKTHPYISTGLKENKFGVDIESAPAVYQRAKSLPGINIVGVDCHIGSQLTELAPFKDALARILALVDELATSGIALQHIDMGGGLGINYSGEQIVPSTDAYLAILAEQLQGRGLKLILEPGRSIAAAAGALVTQVQFLKPTTHKNFAVVDAAMNDLIRPALYQAWMRILPATQRTTPAEEWDIVGPICETADFLGKERRLSLEQGDLLVVLDAGAYGFGMASNYNSRPRVAEVMVEGEQSWLVRERETFADMIRGEHLLP
ncbi:diaminopimelate decarboxylase [Halioxenophilus sp. WMMB6]|uniref:diaminopimelate decarboxylase n=1 Tax=Halioxenophilus sp. WMMB6 TaxID=3073815 RepID=UPI00295EFA8C|nr:diaminopimelate decarboxylase [Halioxenophilus sp. WMMB6]